MKPLRDLFQRKLQPSKGQQPVVRSFAVLEYLLRKNGLAPPSVILQIFKNTIPMSINGELDPSFSTYVERIVDDFAFLEGTKTNVQFIGFALRQIIQHRYDHHRKERSVAHLHTEEHAREKERREASESVEDTEEGC